MSVPIDSGAYPALTLTADPVEEPPGFYDGVSNKMALKFNLFKEALVHCSRESDHLAAHHLE